MKKFIAIERKRIYGGALTVMLALSAGMAWAQEPAPVPHPPATPAEHAPDPALMPAPSAAPATAPDPQTPDAMPAQGTPAYKLWSKDRKGKPVYIGPMTIVELAPTPMLDEEGKQRLDPDGKPMFNAPVRQRRDKQGHPVFDEKGEPVFQTARDLGFDEKGKKIDAKKDKPPKTVSVSISRGTLTVDGLIGKAGLNYEIADLKYIYLYAPWVGTVVVSNVAFPGAKEQPNAFNEHTLLVKVDEHTFEVYSDKLLLGKKPESAFVLVNRDFKLPSKAPEIGYGATLRAPYVWPGAKENPSTKGYAPPVPASLRPTVLLSPCPAGQMRAAARPTLPGEPVLPPPCVPIPTGKRIIPPA